MRLCLDLALEESLQITSTSPPTLQDFSPTSARLPVLCRSALSERAFIVDMVEATSTVSRITSWKFSLWFESKLASWKLVPIHAFYAFWNKTANLFTLMIFLNFKVVFQIVLAVLSSLVPTWYCFWNIHKWYSQCVL